VTDAATAGSGSDGSIGTEESDVFRDKRRDEEAVDTDGQEVPAESAGNPEVAQLATDLAERTADLQRVTAEYANYRKRVDRDREVAAVTAKAAVVGDLLGVLDDIELAQKHGDLNGAFKSVAERLISTLERAGLKGFGAEGDAFDPAHHEAVQFGTSVDVDTPTVTSVFRRGYEFKERPLRAAVVVVTGPDQDAAPRPTNGDAVSTPDTPDSEAADEQDRVDDAKARAEQESKTGTVPTLVEEPGSGSDATTEPTD
jgi:molecular chaperone GrpE